MIAPEYLIEITAWVSGEERVLRLSTCGYNTAPSDTPPNAHYANCVADPGFFTRHLFGQSRTMGQSEVGYGEIVVANADGEFDGWIDYGFDGRPVIVKRIASSQAPYATAETVLRGTVERLDSLEGWTSLRLRFYDRRRELDRPIQTNRYAGTTLAGGPTAEGNLDLKDQVKPLVFGKVLNVEAVLVNPFDLIYQVNDGPVVAIEVFDSGVPLALADDYPDIETLQEAAIAPGRYATCVALGLFRLGGAPARAVTANVSEGDDAEERYPGAIVTRMLAKMGLTGPANVNAATFANLDTLAPYEVGIWIDAETQGLAAMGEVLSSVGGWIAPNELGAFEVGRHNAPGTPIGTITHHDMIDGMGIVVTDDTDGGIPTWRVILEYARNWTVQDDGDLGGCVDMERRAFLAAEMREQKAEDETVKLKHLLSPELRIPTLLVNQEDAETEADRRLGLYSGRRDVLTFSMVHSDADSFQEGATVTIQHPRFGYDNGRDMVVIGREERLAEYQVQLTVWG